jgi:hypothetical protein
MWGALLLILMACGSLNALWLWGQIEPQRILQNLITNGDFEAGNKAFSSEYTASDSTQPEGTYTVGRDPVQHHPGAASYADHTSGKGLMMIVNGAPAAGRTVWEQTVRVDKNRVYDFSAWAASWGKAHDNEEPSPAHLKFFINGVAVGEVLVLSEKDGRWSRFSSVWNSGSNSSASLTIVDLNIDAFGNAFSLDDLQFVPRPT